MGQDVSGWPLRFCSPYKTSMLDLIGRGVSLDITSHRSLRLGIASRLSRRPNIIGGYDLSLRATYHCFQDDGAVYRETISFEPLAELDDTCRAQASSLDRPALSLILPEVIA